MNTIKLSNDLYMYMFPPDEGKELGLNIFVLYQGDECIVFDTGYERHMKQLLPELENKNIRYVICTHFHPDHCYGLKVLPKQNLIGSSYALETLKMFKAENNLLLIPNIVVEDELEIDFYDHTIKIKSNPGHSNCEMIININDTFLLVGDEYMTTNNDEPVLPYVAETISQHIQALTNIVSNYNGYTYLPSHGVPTKDQSKLENRINYLKFALTKNKNMDNFYSKDDIQYSTDSWHRLNIRKP